MVIAFKYKSKINKNEKSDDKENNELNKFTNIFIDKVSKNIDELDTM